MRQSDGAITQSEWGYYRLGLGGDFFVLNTVLLISCHELVEKHIKNALYQQNNVLWGTMIKDHHVNTETRNRNRISLYIDMTLKHVGLGLPCCKHHLPCFDLLADTSLGYIIASFTIH